MAYPFFGEEFTFVQPDGTQLRVRGWGDQNRAVFETLDGFTVVRDPVTGFYQYATVTDDGAAYHPTGVRAEAQAPQQLGLQAGVRVSRAASRAQAQLGTGLPKPYWQIRREQKQIALRAMMAAGIAAAPPTRETVGEYLGLCLLIQFPDVPGTIPQQEVEAFCNQAGYTGFGNRGSVYDYFHDNSVGKLRYTTTVAPYYTAKHPRGYYTNPAVRYGERARELIREALTYHVAQGFDFSRLTADDEGHVYATNVFYAGERVNNWSEGLWPHASRLLTPFPLTSDRQAFDYQITDIGYTLALGTYCHENGHMLCDFPDLYDYGGESAGVGGFCLMAAGGNLDRHNPTQIGAYLKYRAGWAGSVTQITDGLQATATAGCNEFFIHEKSAAEYFILENRFKSGRDEALPDSGLAIWHVDELGSNDNEQMTPRYHYECSLEQADGRCDLEHSRLPGDNADLFSSGGNNRFGGATKPSSKWWNGQASGLEVFDISPAGAEMRFSAKV